MVWLAGCAWSASGAFTPKPIGIAAPNSAPRPADPPAEQAALDPNPSLAPQPVAELPIQTAFTISMPVYQQVMNLDCETAALQMALASLGHSYTQGALFASENADPRLPTMNADGSVRRWGDPYLGFVGNVNGSDLAPTGYGVYYPVILAIARSHGAPGAVGGEDLSSATIYAALLAGHPVVAWVETGWERVRYPLLGTWISWNGRPIHYSLIEHTVTLSGVSPTGVRVNDPWHAGSQYWISKAVFETSWRDLNDMAVIF